MFPKLFSKKVLTLLIISIFSLQFSFGQNNYLSGYIITKGDTIKGLINYKDWHSSPKIISFKKDSLSIQQQFTPNDITSFKVSNEIYISSDIDIEISPIQTSELGTEPKLKVINETAFIRVIFDGKKKMYNYRSSKYRKDFFYIYMDGKLQLLVYKRYISKTSNNQVIVENKRYTGQLSFFLGDYSKVQSKIKKTEYTEESLISLFNTYYECIGEDAEFKGNPKTLRAKGGFLIGVSKTALYFNSNENTFLTETNFSKSTDFVGGGFINIILPGHFERLSIYNELIYMSYTVEGNTIGHTRSTYSKIGSTSIAINNLFRYTYTSHKKSIYVNAGISFAFTVSERNKKEETYLNYPNAPIVESEAVEYPRKLEAGLLIGVGAKYDNFSLEARFMRGNGMVPYDSVGLGSTTDRLFLIFSYQI